MANINVRDYIDENYGLFINNEFQASGSGETITVTNPANGEDLAKVARAGKEDVDKAVQDLTVGVKFLKQNAQTIYQKLVVAFMKKLNT